MDPLLIDGITAFIVFALTAEQFVGTRRRRWPGFWLSHRRADPHPPQISVRATMVSIAAMAVKLGADKM